TVGQTGNASGQPATEAHVHFEVRVNGIPRNPATYLNVPCNWSITQPNNISGNWRIIFPR
ncbi:MAG: M23 family metallopeptidase, partial [Anaerolineae bacterium]|nr:M23 family metallopeptidase [Anaerolineae bacterium]